MKRLGESRNPQLDTNYMSPQYGPPAPQLGQSRPAFVNQGLSAPMSRLAGNYQFATPQRGFNQTPLNNLETAGYQQFLQGNHIWVQPPDELYGDYDTPGFYQAMSNPYNPQHDIAQQSQSAYDGRMHFPDYWKTLMHRSFSGDSQQGNYNAPRWFGGSDGRYTLYDHGTRRVDE